MSLCLYVICLIDLSDRSISIINLCPPLSVPLCPLCPSHAPSPALLVVYTPQRKCARRLNEEEILYDDESVSQILLNDPNSAFISNPVTGERE